MFDVLLLKNKSFMFFSFFVHTSWPAQQESGSQLGCFSQMLKAASLGAGCSEDSMCGQKVPQPVGLGSLLPRRRVLRGPALLTLVAHVEMPLLLGIYLNYLQSRAQRGVCRFCFGQACTLLSFSFLLRSMHALEDL